MTEYKEGDLVEGVKGESVIRGRLDNIGNLKIDGIDWRVAGLIRIGFTITVIEKAAPVVVLPTEPGFYITAYNDPDVFELYLSGDWFLGDVAISEARVMHDGGNQLTRLEPVSETAKKVLDRVRKVWDNNRLRDLDDIGADFGVDL